MNYYPVRNNSNNEIDFIIATDYDEKTVQKLVDKANDLFINNEYSTVEEAVTAIAPEYMQVINGCNVYDNTVYNLHN